MKLTIAGIVVCMLLIPNSISVIVFAGENKNYEMVFSEVNEDSSHIKKYDSEGAAWILVDQQSFMNDDLHNVRDSSSDKVTHSLITLDPDELDQYQQYSDGFYWGVWGENVALAQSFKPTKNIITRVQLSVIKWGSPDGLTVAIRNDLYGSDLTSIYIKAEKIGNYTSWVEFNFSDILLTPESSYYIVFTPYGADDQYNMFFWGLKSKSHYDRGEPWNNSGDGWELLANTSDFMFKTYGRNNYPPNTPSQPTGPSMGICDESLLYESFFSDPNDDDQLQVLFDWGDGSTSGWIPLSSYGIFSVSHSWSANGSYPVRTKAKDQYSFESEWSDALLVVIGNVPPNQPSAPSGSMSGKIFTTYTYSSSTVDLNGDKLFYVFDWGDGTNSLVGEFKSGQTASASHSWSKKGNYTIKVKAIDVKGAESPWSDPMSIAMPYSYNKSIPPFLALLSQRFPNVFLLLQQLLGTE